MGSAPGFINSLNPQTTQELNAVGTPFNFPNQPIPGLSLPNSSTVMNQAFQNPVTTDPSGRLNARMPFDAPTGPRQVPTGGFIPTLGPGGETVLSGAATPTGSIPNGLMTPKQIQNQPIMTPPRMGLLG